MSEYLLGNGDTVMFLPNFGVAMVVVRPTIIKGRSKANVMGKKVCVEGDQKHVLVLGCVYTTPIYIVPGVGNLSIKSLAQDQKSKLLKINNKLVLLQGGNFKASFKVVTPAQTPPAPTPNIDTTLEYRGSGKFITSNRKWKSK